MRSDSGSLAERLRWARERAFVGRRRELALFRAALDGAPGAPAVLHVHGPGGVGKSTLLRRFADESRDAGRPVVEVNGRLTDPSPAGFRAEAAALGTAPDAVLLIDAFEHCQGLEGWLRDHFLPGLPGRTLVVLAGREGPSPAWIADLAWSEALAVVPLADLDPADAEQLLELRQVAPAVRERVLAFAGGHPLALSLAAGVAARGDGDDPWAPTPDVLTALLSHMVGEVPTAEHRLALEIAAHAMTTTEGLLRAVLGPDRGADLFTWLRRLPVADWGRQGMFLHDLVGDAVDTDLRWRDPEGYEEMHRRVGHHLLDQARTASPAEAMVAIRELSYLKRYGPMGDYFRMRREGDFHEDVLRPGDHDVVRRLIAEAEGPESAAVVDFWLERQPEAFWMYRDSATGEAAAFMTWLRLSEPRPDELAADPVLAQAWEHIVRTGPLRPGEHLLLARFLIHPSAYYEISPVLHLMQLRICAGWIRSGALAWSFIISPFPDLWEALMEHLGHERATVLAWPNGHTYTLFACDWRITPLSVWFDRTQPGALNETPAHVTTGRPAVVPLARADFDAAVRDALRDWHRPDALTTGPLATTRMVTDQPGYAAEHAGAMLRELLADAVDALRADPRDAKFHRVVTTTYFHRVPGQTVAAERLSLPYSTYRRHLRRGCLRVCDILWQRETSGRPIPAPDA
ncbi:ATP-binding protein [uncultured Streptomyces sp.]|uniref:ATP-binding protein n=1 Tax=uncultured Streptomyces sp. TaxID=174707 RepID=UPI002619CE83|nr:ATP-binding protein [uncultured Streptomyces sp.]